MSSQFAEPEFLTEEDKVNLPRVRKRKAQLIQEISLLKNEVKDVDAELESLYYLDTNSKHRTRIFGIGRRKFNADPWKGIEYLSDRKLVSKDPRMIAAFLFQGEGLTKSAIGELLGSNDPFDLTVLEQFTKCHDFSEMFIVEALRVFLWSFRLPGESQKIDRIIQSFADRFVEQNPGAIGDADSCHTIAYSCIMLNTLLHNPNVKDRPNFERYLSMNKELVESATISNQTLQAIFDSIKTNEFKIPQEESGTVSDIMLNSEREGWLYKQSSSQFISGPLSWKKRWFVLAESCLYYFEQKSDKEPRGIIPLANVGVRRVEQASRPYMFEIYSLSDGPIKACKNEQDGRMVEGRHSVYRICAVNDEDLVSWINAVSIAMPTKRYPNRPKSTH